MESTATAQVWEGPPMPVEGSGQISVAEFNDFVEVSRSGWSRSPRRAAFEFLRLDDPEASTTTIVMETNPEGVEQAVVTVTLEGLLDDSVGAVQYVLVFEQVEGGTYLLVSARWTQQCAPGRGHREFSAEPCV